VRAASPSEQARAREAPYSRHPTSNRLLRTSQPQALDCWENHSSRGARSARGQPLRTSPGSRGSVLAPPNKQSSPPNKPAAGSGLLGESQLSGRTECARPAPPNKPGIARLRTRATQQAIVSSEQASRRLWTAGSITALGAHGVRAACPPYQPGIARLRTRATQQAIVSSEQASRRLWTAVSHHSSRGARSARGLPSVPARDREAPYSRHPTSNRLLRTSQPQALDCWENHSSRGARSARGQPLRTSPGSRGSVLAPPNKQSSPPNKPAAGSGLLGASQLSGRTECARPAPPNKPGHARLRTRATQQAIVSSEQASRRLWTAGRITALGAHRVRAASPSEQARDREAPYSRHPTSNRLLRTSQPKALDCWENHSSQGARSARGQPLRTSPGSRGSVLAPPNKQSSPPNKPAAGSGLLGASQLSGRAECARPTIPTSPSHFSLPRRTPFIHHPILSIKRLTHPGTKFEHPFQVPLSKRGLNRRVVNSK
jgi:hypothetical protein